MKRLREDVNSADPIVANAARMVADLAPLSESEVRSARVLRAMNRRKQAAAPRFSRPLLAAMIVMGTAATAGAALGVSGWLGSDDTAAPQPTVTSQDIIAPKSTVPSLSPLKQSPAREAAVQNDEDEALPATTSAVVAKPSVSGKPVQAKASSSAKPPSASLSPASQAALVSEAALVQQAVEALRHSNNPAQAAALLKEYRQKAPSGALAEEALALSIEVAVAQGSAQAPIYAAQYLKSYPSGRFRSLAQSALR